MLPYFIFQLARAKISPLFSISSRFPKIGHGIGPEQPCQIQSSAYGHLHLQSSIRCLAHHAADTFIQLVGFTRNISQAEPCYRIQQRNHHLQESTMWGPHRLYSSAQRLVRRRTTKVKAKKSHDRVAKPKKVMTG